MPINPLNIIPPNSYFGVKNPQEFMKIGFGRLIRLKAAMKSQIGFADLGLVKINAFTSLGQRTKQIKEFQDTQLATLTLIDDSFRHSESTESLSTHTIGLVINKNPNEYFYKSQPEILLIDSMGPKYGKNKDIHSDLIEKFLKPLFPDARFTISQKIQQSPDSLTCLNWTLANLSKARQNLGRADLLTLLPDSNQLDSILEDQMKILEKSRAKL